MRAKRPIVTLYSDAAYYGGAEVYLSLLAQHVDKERFQLTALVPEDPPVSRLEEELVEAGATVRRHRRPGLSWVDAIRRLTRDFKAIGGEILHINLPSTYDAALSSVAVAGRLAGYHRVVTTEHLPMIERKYRKFPAKILFSEAIDCVLVPSHATREYVVERHHLPREKTTVLPYGVTAPKPLENGFGARLRAETETPPDARVLGIVGRLTERKGHRDLFGALARLQNRDRLKGVCLWVIGEGEDEQELRHLSGELGIAEAIRFLGPRSDAADLMPLLDLLLVPSHVETTPFVILEAMAAGRAVIASRVYGIPEMIDDNESGLLVDPGDVDALASALEQLLGQPERIERFGHHGRERYERFFSADQMARGTERVYLGNDAGGDE